MVSATLPLHLTGRLVVLLVLAIAFALVMSDSTRATSFHEIKKLTASDAQKGDRFGFGVAIDGDTMIVGATLEDAGGHDAGAAYVLQQDQGGADNWGEVTKLTASDADADDFFGGSVSVSGDTSIVGASGEDAGGSRAGAVYVFQRDEGGANSWGEMKKLVASDAESGDDFGTSVAVSGDTAIVGAPLEDAGGSAAGAGYIFQRDEGGADNWGEVTKLTASDADFADYLGVGVAIFGDTAVVGAWGEDAGGSFAGAAYIFQRDEGGANNWGEVTKLSAAPPSSNFGDRVSISGDTVVVSAHAEDTGGNNAGAAYVFQRDEGGVNNWGEVTKLTGSDVQARDQFGRSVGIDGATIVVGAIFEEAGASDAGAVYTFQRDEGGAENWGQVTKLSAFKAETNDFFGISLAVSGNIVVAGAYPNNTIGAAYVFDLLIPKPTPTPCDEVCTTPTPTPTRTNTPPPPTSLPPVDGAEMSLSINGQTGKVNVLQNSFFAVAVNIKSFPATDGYTGVQAWVDFGSTGLVGKKSPHATYEDCEPATFVFGQLGNAENAGCLHGVIAAPPSFFKGEVFTFDVTCDKSTDQSGGGPHTITLIALGDLVASHSGAGFDTSRGVVPAEHTEVNGRLVADTIDVTCVPEPTHTPTPTPCPGGGCPVGGIALDSDLRALALETNNSGGSPWAGAGGIVAAIVAAAVLLALGGAAWYAKRRRSYR